MLLKPEENLRVHLYAKRKYRAFMSRWAINRKVVDSKLSGSTMFADRNEVEVTTLSGHRLGEN